MPAITSYTTRYGRIIPARVMADLLTDIAKGVDYQTSITDHTRDLIPVHDEDYDEAMEVYGAAEEMYYELTHCLDCGGTKPHDRSCICVDNGCE